MLLVSTTKKAASQKAKRRWGRYPNGQWPTVSVYEVAEVDGHKIIVC